MHWVELTLLGLKRCSRAARLLWWGLNPCTAYMALAYHCDAPPQPLQELRDLLKLDLAEVHASPTLRILNEMHAGQRRLTPQLSEHLRFLETLAGFAGIVTVRVMGWGSQGRER